ncbi:hypothetical protein DKX38_027010 [Salix brachista]|uniref:Uncharacterized protein n=1 Tax=Salix brachista TaxID=2182728 RepID=A0A5N5JBZ4_9ROSI|nr:hypothetical protein DKX38_027010 [Salix brachista]
MFDQKIETLPYQNHVVSNGNLASTNPNSAKKSKKSERYRRRSNQKKKSQAPDASAAATVANGDDSDATNDDSGDAKENADSQHVVEQVNVSERIWHELAHLTEELDEAEAESAKISNEIEFLNSTYMEDSSELESDLKWMSCSLVLIPAQQDRERENEDEQMECFSSKGNQSKLIYTHDEKQF